MRVRLDVNKKLTRFVAINKASKNDCYKVKYEKLPIFCGVCGLLGYWQQECGTGKYDPASLEWGVHPNGEVEVAAPVVADVKEEKMMSSNLIEPFGRGRGVGFGPGENYDRSDGRTEGNLPVGNWRFNGIYAKENKGVAMKVDD